MTLKLTIGILFGLLVAATPAAAQHSMEPGQSGHGMMDHGSMPAEKATGDAKVEAVVHSVDAAASKINVTHEPVKELGWPKMTMDLDVTKQVDLANLKPGSKVRITLKQGMDKKYRVISIEPSN